MMYDFEDIRPYYDNEAKAVLAELIKEPVFFKLVNYLWPEMTMEEVIEKAEKVNSNLDFQIQFMHKAIRTIVSRSAKELTYSGLENLDRNKACLFIGNHRDILLDSAILQILLVENNFSTSEITFGNNLMDNGFITQFGKLNRMFKVQREGTNKELYEISKKLSSYIRYTIVNKNISIWIAQRNGRTKDGLDATQTGLLKMLNISGEGSFEENFAQLNIIPLTISYEYEPCDILKAQELYLSSLHTKYSKAPGEDLNSIITGVEQYKGRIHLSFGESITNKINECEGLSNDNEKIKKLASIIDSVIYQDYKLWPTNYIAADLLSNPNQYSKNYSEEEKNHFENYIENTLSTVTGDKENIKQQFLKIYSNPVTSKML